MISWLPLVLALACQGSMAGVTNRTQAVQELYDMCRFEMRRKSFREPVESEYGWGWTTGKWKTNKALAAILKEVERTAEGPAGRWNDYLSRARAKVIQDKGEDAKSLFRYGTASAIAARLAFDRGELWWRVPPGNTEIGCLIWLFGRADIRDLEFTRIRLILETSESGKKHLPVTRKLLRLQPEDLWLKERLLLLLSDSTSPSDIKEFDALSQELYKAFPNRLMYIGARRNLFFNRYRRLHDDEDLREAISWSRRFLSVAPRGSVLAEMGTDLMKWLDKEQSKRKSM